MKRIICFSLMLCLLLLPACTPKAPTADVHAVQLGDTEKQVTEKAGYPDIYSGAEEDVFIYIIDEAQRQFKFLWLCEGKVCIIASMENSSFTEWSISPEHSFVPVSEAAKPSFWRQNMHHFDMIAQLGLDYVSFEHNVGGLADYTYTYALKDGSALKVRFITERLHQAWIAHADGHEEILWQTGLEND